MSVKITSTKARIKLRRILKESTDDIKPIMKRAADDLRDDMHRRVPVDSGNLKENITSFVAKNGLRAEAGFRGKKAKRRAWYARFIEFGTKPHMKSNHPGTRAQPFIAPAWDSQKPQILKATNRAIKLAVDKVSKL